jgi:ubiquitin-like modifier-activating enzyme ATG7
MNSISAGNIRAEGKIKNMNTIEDFKNLDRVAILNVAAKQVSQES